MPADFSPHGDTHIAKRYSISSLDQKVHNKLALQEELGSVPEPKRALICLPLGMSEQLGGKLFMEVLPGLLNSPVEIIVRGKGSADYGTLFTKLADSHKHRIHIMPDDDVSLRRMLASSDIALFLSLATTSRELTGCLQYGVIPVAPEGSTWLSNYDPVQESGNAFLYDVHNEPGDDKWRCFAALTRAIETFKFPFDWRAIQRHAMESVKQ